MSNQQTKVGIGVMIFKDGKVLLACRKGSHGSGEYAFPGGHLEYMEGFEECARREVLEECGIEIDDINFLLVANVLQYAPKHYVHITLTAKWTAGVPTVLEPQKAESWNWYSLESLPVPLFEMSKLSIESYKNCINYYDRLSL
ncbi:MAG TPA: NUDIX domain-containing protein [Selenomonadales bacterium]|nr:NUDIX domain-containing protein [Selenomonadales bacterium]